MSTRVRSRSLLAWSLWLVAVGCCAAGLLVALVVTRPLTLAVLVEGAVFALAFPLGYATVGLVLALRRPANPIGWLYAASGLVWSLLLPDGRLRSRRWRVVVVTAVTGAVMVTVAGALMPGRTAETPRPIDNPFGLAGSAGTLATVLTSLGLALSAVSYPAALASLLLRFRASRGVERQQLRWVAAGAAVAVAGLPLGQASGGVTYLALVAGPVAVAVAVLRYRLWDLDRLVSRTVTYALVTGLLVLPYLLILPAAARLTEGSGSLAVAAATLLAAAAFAPLRRRVQDAVDRRFNRRRYDAARTVDAFAARLRDQVDLDVLSGELLAVVDQTVEPTWASLWLRPPASARPQR